jgi:hypothetical protein
MATVRTLAYIDFPSRSSRYPRISMSKMNGCQKAGNDLTHIKSTPQKLFTLAYLRLNMTSLLEHMLAQPIKSIFFAMDPTNKKNI